MESKYSDNVVLSAVMAILVILFDYGVHSVTGYLANASFGYYFLCGIVAFFVSFLIFEGIDDEKLIYRILAFAIAGPVIEAILLVFIPLYPVIFVESLVLGFFVFGLTGALIYSAEKGLRDWF